MNIKKERRNRRIREMPKRVNVNEGMTKKGGLNPKPSTPRPSEPPRGHTPKPPERQKKD